VKKNISAIKTFPNHERPGRKPTSHEGLFFIKKGVIREMNNQNGAFECEVIPGKLLDIKALSQCLGVQIKTIYCWVHARQIPYVKVGRLVRFDPGIFQSGWKTER